MKDLSKINFDREYSGAKPVMIRGAASDWPAFDIWTKEYLFEVLKAYRLVDARVAVGNQDLGLESAFPPNRSNLKSRSHFHLSQMLLAAGRTIMAPRLVIIRTCFRH